MSAATLTPVIERTLVAQRRQRYARYASGLAAAVADDKGKSSVTDVTTRYLRRIGVRVRPNNTAVRAVIDAIQAHLDGTDQPQAGVVGGHAMVGAGVEQARDVIRAFLTDGSKHLEREDLDGFQADEIDALLVLAGLLPADEAVQADPAGDLLAAAVKDKDLRVRIVQHAVDTGFQV